MWYGLAETDTAERKARKRRAEPAKKRMLLISRVLSVLDSDVLVLASAFDKEDVVDDAPRFKKVKQEDDAEETGTMASRTTSTLPPSAHVRETARQFSLSSKDRNSLSLLGKHDEIFSRSRADNPCRSRRPEAEG
jgi:hypothetical protein